MGQHVVDVNDANFATEVLQAQVPVLVDFWASWCGPCLMIAPAIDELAAQYQGRIKVAKMNVEENKHTPYEYGVRSIPYLVVFKEGKVVANILGAQPKAQIAQMLDKVLASA